MRRSTALLLPLLALLVAGTPFEEGHDGGDLQTSAESAAPVAPWAPPEERSARPKPGEWAHADPLTLPRPHALCRALRIREWVRVACKHEWDDYMGARIIGGSHEDVGLEAPIPDPGEPKSTRHADVVFPVRRGDRRLIEIPRAVSAGFRSYSIEEEAVVIISALWLPGDAAPVITLH